MIIIKCELKFKSVSTIKRVLDSIVYDEDLCGFYKCSQLISPELTQELNNPNGVVDIKDVINPLDGVLLSDKEIKELVNDFFKNDYVNYTILNQSKLVNEARDFLTKYKRDINISEILGSD
jgi:hypothetical protein